MRRSAFLSLLLLLLFRALATAGQDSDSLLGRATPVEAERTDNLRAFEELYRPWKEAGFGRHAGHWLVIAGGRLHPRNLAGRPSPTPDLETALAAAASVPGARQRFVFRVGEEGDVRYEPTASSREDLVGCEFLDLFEGNVWITPEGTWLARPGGRWEEGERIGSGIEDDRGPIFRATVRAIDGARERSLELQIATGYTGHAILGARSAAALGLELWEIPGAVIVHEKLPRMRRSRARFVREDGRLDAEAPVAVRTEAPVAKLDAELWTALRIAAGVQEPEMRTFELPEEPSAVVLSLDYSGGFAPARRSDAPHLAVCADGTLRVSEPYAVGPPRTGRLEADELQALLRFVVEDQRLLEFDAKKAEEELRAARGDNMMRVMDAADTVVKVALPAGRVEARFNALGIHVREAPVPPSLARLAAVERRLQTLRNVVLVGGREKAEELLALANQRLHEDYPERAPFTLEELVFVRASGTRVDEATFQRREGEGSVIASIVLSGEGPPEVTISVPR